MRAFQARHGLPTDELSAWELMLSEASNNAVKYALPEHRSAPWTLEVTITPGTVIARVGDHTAGFEMPDTAPFPDFTAENGRGLPIIFSLSSRRRYDRHPDGNFFTIERPLPSPPHLAQSDPATEAILDSMTEELAAAYESLAAIFRFTSEIARPGSDQNFAASCLHELLPATGADWFVFRSLVARPPCLKLVASSHDSGAAALDELPLADDPASATSLECQAALTNHDVWFGADGTPVPPSDPLLSLGSPLSGVVHPVFVGGHLFGVMAIGFLAPSAAFTAGQVNIIHTFADFLGIQLHNARAQEETLKSRLVTRELEIASNIQRSLLPTSLPNPQGYSLWGSSLSAQQVGGDFYDAIELPGGILLTIADVMGKGVPAAMFAAIFRSQLRARPDLASRPAEFMSWLNHVLFPDLDRVDMFITGQLVWLDAARQTITVASAGHCPALLADGTTVREIAPDGLPLGIFADSVYEQSTEPFGSHCRLLMYTDGITEARDPSGEDFGAARLCDWVARMPANAEVACQELREMVLAHQQNLAASDDITLVALTARPTFP